MATEKLTNAQLAGMELADWRVLEGPLYTRYRTGDFATGLRLVDAIGAAAEELNHHPDLDLRYSTVQIRLLSHDVGAKTMRDVELARRISSLAAELGVPTDLESLTAVEYGLDTWDIEQILPFWLAIHGLERGPKNQEVLDPNRFTPTVWFQESEQHETPRQRWHPDVWVPPEFAQARIAAAVTAGGTVVDDSEAPSFTVLADPQGNKVCICTSLER